MQTYIAVSDLVSGCFSQEGSALGAIRAQVLEPPRQAASSPARLQGLVPALWHTLPEARAQAP